MTSVPLAVTLAAAAWIVAAVVMAALWAWHLHSKNAAVVGAGWTALVATFAVIYGAQASGMPGRRLAIASMMGSWGARLTVYLLYDRVFGRPEDGRYTDLRRRLGARAHAWFFWFFQAHAAMAVFFSLPALLAATNPNPEFAPIELAAVGLWIVAFSGETTADRQLLAFRSNPENGGRTCRAGLWRFSRHPNYFFEWLMWVACALFAVASPWGWIALACPLVMLYLLFTVAGVTGIPATEAQALRSRGADYRQYQATTSAFVPWFPRRSAERPADAVT